MSDTQLQDYAIIPSVQLQTLQSELDRFRNESKTDCTLPVEETSINIRPEDISGEKTENVEQKKMEVVEPEKEKCEPEITETPHIFAKPITNTTTKKTLKAEKSPQVKNLNKHCRSKQLKEELTHTGTSLPKNIDALISASVGRSKKKLANESEFYQLILDKNLTSLVTNPYKFVQYIKPSMFKI